MKFSPIVILDSTNYFEWAQSTQAQLTLNGHWDVIDPEEEEPPVGRPARGNAAEAADAAALLAQQEKKAKAALMLSVSAQYKLIVQRAPTARAAWITLEEQNQGQVEALKHQTRQQLSKIKKEQHEDMVQYHSRIRTLAYKLEMVNMPPTDTELVGYALGGLGPEYNSSMAVLQHYTIDTTFEGLLKHLLLADNLAESIDKQARVMALSASTTRRGGGGRGGRGAQGLVCWTCGKEGHFKYQCPDKAAAGVAPAGGRAFAL